MKTFGYRQSWCTTQIKPVQQQQRSTGGGSSLSKLISCIRGTSGLTQADVDDCYNTAYADSSSSNGANTYGGLVPLGSQ